LLTLLIKGAEKKGVGDLMVKDVHVEVKSKGSRLGGIGRRGGLDHPTNIKKKLVEVFKKHSNNWDVLGKLLQNHLAFNIRPSEGGFINSVRTMLSHVDSPTNFVHDLAHVFRTSWSGFGEPYLQAMKYYIEHPNEYQFFRAFVAFNFSTYQSAAGWHKLLLIDPSGDAMIFSTTEEFLHAWDEGLITASSFDMNDFSRAGFRISITQKHTYPRVEKKFDKETKGFLRKALKWAQNPKGSQPQPPRIPKILS
jgi:hypothetical protein